MLLQNPSQIGFYREAVSSQSPGLFQPWELKLLVINPDKSGVESYTFCEPRVEATLGWETQPLRGKARFL